jgi:hypothetical protein
MASSLAVLSAVAPFALPAATPVLARVVDEVPPIHDTLTFPAGRLTTVTVRKFLNTVPWALHHASDVLLTCTHCGSIPNWTAFTATPRRHTNLFAQRMRAIVDHWCGVHWPKHERQASAASARSSNKSSPTDMRGTTPRTIGMKRVAACELPRPSSLWICSDGGQRYNSDFIESYSLDDSGLVLVFKVSGVNQVIRHTCASTVAATELLSSLDTALGAIASAHTA